MRITYDSKSHSASSIKLAILVSLVILTITCALSSCASGDAVDNAAMSAAVETSVAATMAVVPPTATLPPATPTPTPVSDPFTRQWRDQNLKYVETIATKLELVETMAQAWATGSLSDEEARRPILTGFTYAVDVLGYREFLLKSTESNLRLNDEELNAIADLQSITDDNGACSEASEFMLRAINETDSRAKSELLTKFVDAWSENCRKVAQESLEVLRQHR